MRVFAFIGRFSLLLFPVHFRPFPPSAQPLREREAAYRPFFHFLCFLPTGSNLSK